MGDVNFIKENWFKLATLVVGAYVALTVPFDYAERQLWAEERLKTYEVCLTAVMPNNPADITQAGYTSAYDGLIAAFRACKNMSESF